MDPVTDKPSSDDMPATGDRFGCLCPPDWFEGQVGGDAANRIRRRGDGGLVLREAFKQLDSVPALVGEFEEDVPGKFLLDVQVPLLGVRVANLFSRGVEQNPIEVVAE